MITAVLVLSFLACFSLGLVILVQEHKKLANVLFASICFCFAVWAVAIALFVNASTPGIVQFSAKIFYVVAGLFPALLLMFSLVFPDSKTTPKGLLVAIGFVGALIVGMLIIDPQFVTGKAITSPTGNYIEVDKPSYILYSAYFVAFFTIAIGIALWKFITYRGKRRFQASLYAAGILINSIPGFVTNLILPYFGQYDYIWIGPAASVFFLVLTTYSIVRHRLFDIRAAAVRTLAYVLSLLSLAMIYFGLAYVASVTIFKGEVSSSVSVSPVNIALALVLSFVFQPIKQFFDKITDSIFFRDRYNTDDFIARVSEVLTTTTDLRSLLQRAAHEIGMTLKAEQAFFYVEYGGTKHMTAGTEKHGQLPVADVHWLKNHLTNDTIQVADSLDQNSHMHKLLVSHKVAALMPLMHKGEIMGFLALGEQRGSRYSTRDIKVLAAISDELVIAIQNSLSVQEVRDINASLEQRIESATAELRTSNARLKRLDATKDEFISMASHQLRTPLTSIKGYLSMVLEGDVGKISEDQQHLLQEAFDSSERMVHLIHDFLNVSRLQNGKFMLEQHPYDLVALVKGEVNSLIRSANARGLKLTYKTSLKELNLMIDETKIRQVVMNFVDNALYYSRPNGTITVKLEKVGDSVELRVVDDGIGVPKAEQEHLFTKFFRAGNARKQRPDGTGVGIFLAKKVIDAQGGEIIFESTEGVGSTFGFRLPIRTLSSEQRS